MYKNKDEIIYSPSDLITYTKSPFSSWMDRYHLYNTTITPDEKTEDIELICSLGNKHEKRILEEFKISNPDIIDLSGDNFNVMNALNSKASVIYQARLSMPNFSGITDFLILNEDEKYQVWDTKLANSPKPYYIIQLCCYSDMLKSMGIEVSDKIGIILGSGERVEFSIEDYIHYYNNLKNKFLLMQNNFTGLITNRPEPLSSGEHGRWTSYAEKYFTDMDHLVRVSGITSGQIKKINACGITTLTELANFDGVIDKMTIKTAEKLISQAKLQYLTIKDREVEMNMIARYDILPFIGANNEHIGLALLPVADAADVFFDIEGYPLIQGGLEYLFGVYYDNQYKDWWAHDRAEEKVAFESFIDWIYYRWNNNKEMHVYHYASYEVSAINRLSLTHNTRQFEVDKLLWNNVFIDLYKIVRNGLRIGEENYSLKTVEKLYSVKRGYDGVSNAVSSIVEYAKYIDTGDLGILKSIRDYNEVDCVSTFSLYNWLLKVAVENDINIGFNPVHIPKDEVISTFVNTKQDATSVILGDLIDFHYREEKPMWRKMFERIAYTDDELYDDPCCIQGIEAVGLPFTDKQSLVQEYRFDPEQECTIDREKSIVMFAHIEGNLTLIELDIYEGSLKLKMSKKLLVSKYGGSFPQEGSLILFEYISAAPMEKSLLAIATNNLTNILPKPIESLLGRIAPAEIIQDINETTVDAAIRVSGTMSGDCLVIQGPPGTGKTYTAAHVIAHLLVSGKKIGIAANSHKVVINLLSKCGEVIRENGDIMSGIKVGGDYESRLHLDNDNFSYIESNTDAYSSYNDGIIGGTSWLFSRPEWEDKLDYLFIDEAGQVSLANTVAISRCAKNIILLGDQMQLEQPIQGRHPRDSGLSALQYTLKDENVFHKVVPDDYGLFLGETYRMHPSICDFISNSIYEGKLFSNKNCINQRIIIKNSKYITKENGIIFSGVEHDGNIQQSQEEVDRIIEIYNELLGNSYVSADGSIKELVLEDFIFISPYNSQVRLLQLHMSEDARIGSVDRFQGQQAQVCIFSLCSSYGEYGSRGLSFILNQNRINVAISRAKCMAIIVGDPRIANTNAKSIKEMKLLNLLCKTQ